MCVCKNAQIQAHCPGRHKCIISNISKQMYSSVGCFIMRLKKKSSFRPYGERVFKENIQNGMFEFEISSNR